LLRRQAWAGGDAHAFAAWYAEDATAILPGFYQNGREDIQAGMSAPFAGPLNGSPPQHEPQSVRFAGEDTAIVVTRSGPCSLVSSTLPPSGRTWRPGC
jgi:uncharacterized protein (TIGR02246 family)